MHRIKSTVLTLFAGTGALLLYLTTDHGQQLLETGAISALWVAILLGCFALLIAGVTLYEVLSSSSFPKTCWQDWVALTLWHALLVVAFFSIALPFIYFGLSFWLIIVWIVLSAIPVDKFRDLFMSVCQRLYQKQVAQARNG